MKFIALLYDKKINFILDKYLKVDNNFFFTFSKEIIKNEIDKKNFKIINTQKNITVDNKKNFIEIIKYIPSNKYLLLILWKINCDTIFQNYLKKGKTKILKHFVNNYEINKIPFDFVFQRILLYNKYTWSQKYSIKYCITLLIDNNLLGNPSKEQSIKLLEFIKNNKLNSDEYNFSPYWERQVFQKLWIFFMSTPFINVILDKLLKKINNDDIENMSECPICYCKVNKNDFKLDCNHCFHQECIAGYYQNKNYLQNQNFHSFDNENIILDCPYCRKIVLEI